MNTTQLVKRLREQLKQIEQEVLQHDAALAKSQQKLLEDTDRFNNTLFIQSGAQLKPCVEQISQSINQLERQLKYNMDPQAIILSCERIQDRFLALKRALSTTDLNLKISLSQRASKKRFFQKRKQKQHQQSGFSWIASGIMLNSHKLYTELNKHFTWATKIENKIADLQLKMTLCHQTEKLTIQNEILSQYKRLGKCKQAITYIEEQIQEFESKLKN